MISPGPSTGLGAAGAFPLECLVSAPASFGMCQAGNLEARPLPRSRSDSLLERTLSQSPQTRGNRAWSSCRDALGQRAPAWHQIAREDKRPGDSGAEMLLLTSAFYGARTGKPRLLASPSLQSPCPVWWRGENADKCEPSHTCSDWKQAGRASQRRRHCHWVLTRMYEFSR